MLKKLPLLYFLLLTAVLPAQQSSILWRISGKNLSKPSYLYGTIHVKDKRIFQVNDSLMHYLDACELFAAELNPDSLNRMMYQLMNQTDTTDERSHFSAEDYELVKRKLKKDLGIDLSKVKSKNYRVLKALMSEGKARSDDYPTFLDGYLGEIARRKHKTVIGLESISIHTEAFSSLTRGEDFYRKDLVNLSREDRPENQYEAMIGSYLKGDIAGIQKQTTDYNYELQYDLIYNRNRYMAHTIDSVLKTHTLFATCGAAHLGGKDGLVQMLKDLGYTLTPIPQAGKTYLSLAGLPVSFDSWQKVNTPGLGFSYEMPGEPTAYTRSVMYADMKTYTDIGSGGTYLVLPAAVTTDASDVQKIYDEAFKRVEKQAGTSLKPPKKITYKEVEGVEIEYPSLMGQSLRMRMFVTNNILYSFTVTYPVGYNGKEEIDHFFNSVSFFKPVKGEMSTYTYPRWGVELQLPAKPEEKSSVEKQYGTRRENFALKASDNIAGIHYILECGDVGPGKYFPHDSLVLGRMYQAYKDNERVSYIRDSSFSMQDARVRQTIIRFTDNSMMVSWALLRGFRYYDLMAIMRQETEKERIHDAIFSSFRFLPQPANEFKEFRSPLDTNLWMRLPQAFQLPERDTLSEAYSLGTDENTDYRAYDFQTGMTYYLREVKASRYAYAQSDSAFWKDKEEDAVSYNDSLLYARPLKIGEVTARELLIRPMNSDCVRRTVILPFGNTTYRFYTYMPVTDSSNARMLQPFRSMRYTNYKPVVLPSDTAAFRRLLGDLFSPDSLLREKAEGKFYDFKPTDRMFAQLRAVLDTMKAPAADSIAFVYSPKNRLIYLLNSLHNPERIPFAIAKLNDPASGLTYRTAYASVLRNASTAEAYDGLKAFYRQNISELHNYYGSSDSLALVARLFPELLEAYAKDKTNEYYLNQDVMNLLDTGLLAYAAVQPYEASVMERSRNLAAEADEEYYSGYSPELLSILNHMPAKEGFYEHCRALLKSKSTWAKLYAAVYLIRNKQAVPPAVLEKLCASLYLRNELYNELEKIGALEAFPLKYANQQSLAESDLYRAVYLNDEAEVTSISYVDRYRIEVNGKASEYYAFKVKIKDGDRKQILGFAGPYEPGTTKLLQNGARTGLTYQPYNKGKEQQALNDYVNGNESAGE